METPVINPEVAKAIKEYQCPGCVNGPGLDCFKPNDLGGEGCGKHHAGTRMNNGVGLMFLGLPKGFNRVGFDNSLRPQIHKTLKDYGEYDMFNIPVWKYLNEDGHTLVRGLMPRLNQTFIHIFLENCIDKINCLEITNDIMKKID